MSKAATVLLLSAVSSLLFWYLEASWKIFQTAYYERVEEIEAFFRGERELVPFQIGNSWYSAWKSGGSTRLKRILLWPHVALPHFPVVAIAVFLYLLAVLGYLKL